MNNVILQAIARLNLPTSASHKGENGKLLIIGGSKLFHTSIFWSAEIASRFVDMVHFTSPADENNQLIRQKIKQKLWSGIVVDWQDVESYIEEDDCILIGPGMERTKQTKNLVDHFLKKYPSKKWVIDGGALQEVSPQLLSQTCIITPHQREFAQLWFNYQSSQFPIRDQNGYLVLYQQELSNQQRSWLISKLFSQGVTSVVTGKEDLILSDSDVIEVAGGNAGLTKGGTGDTLAGLIAGLYCMNSANVSTLVASQINKQAGDDLYQVVGPYYNAQDLIYQIPKTLWRLKSEVGN